MRKKLKILFYLIVIISVGFIIYEVYKNLSATRSSYNQQLTESDYSSLHISYNNWLHMQSLPASGNAHIISYITQENYKTDKFLSSYQGLNSKLYEEMLDKVHTNYSSIPKRYGDHNYYYYNNTLIDKPYKMYYRYNIDGNHKDELLFDLNKIAKERHIFDMGLVQMNSDNSLIAYSFDDNSSRNFVSCIVDINTGHQVNKCINDTSKYFVWHPSISNLLFYVKVSESGDSNKVYMHLLNSQHKEDQLFMEVESHQYIVSLTTSSDKAFLFVNFVDYEGNSFTKIIRLNDRKLLGMLSSVIADDYHAVIDHTNDAFFAAIIDDNDRQILYRIPDNAINERQKWQVISQDHFQYLELLAFRNNVVVKAIYKDNKYRVMSLDTNNMKIEDIIFPGCCYAVSIIRTEYNAPSVRFLYSSVIQPETVFEYIFNTKSLVTINSLYYDTVFDPSQYTMEQINIEYNQDTIPVTLIYKNPVDNNSDNFCYVELAAGTYNSLRAFKYKPNVFSLLDRGFIYAIVPLNDSFYPNWKKYIKDPKSFNLNFSTDTFYQAINTLINKKYTSSSRLAIYSYGIGGITAANLINKYPHIAKLAVFNKPVFDIADLMLNNNAMNFLAGSKKLDILYKNISNNFLESYDIYNNLKRQFYPYVLVQSSLFDTVFNFGDAVKFVEKLREYNVSTNTVLLRTYMYKVNAGNLSQSDIFEGIDDAYTFAFAVLGINEK